MSGSYTTLRGQTIDFSRVHPSVLPAYGPYGPDMSNLGVAAEVMRRSRLAFERDERRRAVAPVRGIGPLIVKPTLPGMTKAEGQTLRALVASGMPDDLNAADELIQRVERRNHVDTLDQRLRLARRDDAGQCPAKAPCCPSPPREPAPWAQVRRHRS